MLSGCAARNVDEQIQQASENNEQFDTSDPRDPFEPINRVIWDLNWEFLDRYLVRPATVVYTTVMPQFARDGLLNAALNLEEPGNMVNNFMQGKTSEGVDSLSRFVINSTLGVFGLIDIAGRAGIQRADEDVDEVLGVWGIGNGPYLMLPGAGPNDVRGVTGEFIDNFYFPMTVINSNFNLARFGIRILEARAALIAQEELLLQSPDDYAFVKNAYFQNKEFEVKDGVMAEPTLDEQQLDDFEEFEAFLEDDGGQSDN